MPLEQGIGDSARTVPGAVPLRSGRGSRLSGRLSFENVTLAVVLVAMLLLVGPPLGALIITSFQCVTGLAGHTVVTLGNYVSVLGGLSKVGPVSNSLVFACGSALVALSLGGLLAFIVERTNTPFKSLGYYVAFSILAVPSLVYALAWLLLFGRGGLINVVLGALLGPSFTPITITSLGGMIFIESMIWTPLSFLLLSGPMRALDPALEEAAATSGANRIQILRRITLPMLAPSIAAILILVFMRTLEAFAAPALIGLPGRVVVLTTEVYLSSRSYPPDFGMASAYGSVLIVLVVGLLYAYSLLTAQASRFATVTGKGFQARLISLGRKRYLLTGILLLYFVVLVGLPFFLLIWGSLQPFYTTPSLDDIHRFSLRHYQMVLSYDKATQAFMNSAVVGAISATVIMTLALTMAWLVTRGTGRFRRLLDFFATFPLVFPGIVLGVAMLQFYVRLPLPIYGTLAIFVIAYSTRFLPYGFRYSHAGLVQIHPELEEAALMSGASRLQAAIRITLPLILVSVFAGWTFVFLLCVKELESSVLLTTSNTPIVSPVMYDLWQNGQISQVAAFATVVMVVFGSIGIAAYTFARRRGLPIG